eukprot:CAMPEP_0119353086 /NCGR_PEP_ID=MMETSP1334-20130426/2307_1 /TAXON_ID=127549 /ORGANISM="Calcidiscus leptoporus, Strain RCC1130" /LENGTH=69 /DNA_ID=CAMNT_0007366295 /DNA_START=58 /DNA_END=267 /DNA_ORIENTATION=-
MPNKQRTEDGVKVVRRKKSDKAIRNFELHGGFSSKHLRLREMQLAVRQDEHRQNSSALLGKVGASKKKA